MANISTEVLFHYTSKFATLKKILLSGFLHNLNREEIPTKGFSNSLFHGSGVISYFHYIYMVCFCDIPLGQIDQHVKTYGKYGLGMSKEWAMKNGITPVRYIHRGSPEMNDDFANVVKKALNEALKEGKTFSEKYAEIISKGIDVETDFTNIPERTKNLLVCLDEIATQYNEFFDKNFSPYLKVYEGDRSKKKNIVRFYNEREWRSVRFEANRFLKFEFDDIEAILVRSKEEVFKIGEFIIKHQKKLEFSSEADVWTKITVKAISQIFPPTIPLNL